MDKGIVFYAVGSIILLCFNIIAVIFDIMPNWWYYNWLFSPETTKAIALYMSIALLIVMAGVLIIARGK